MRLKDKVAIVTGGARGIGAITAQRFVEEGARVVVFDVNQEELDAFKNKMNGDADKVETAVVDVTDYNAVSEKVNDIIKKYGKLDVMVANAGITRDAMSHKMTEEKFDLVLDVNLKGAYNSARAVIEHMRDQSSGRILFTSSVVGEYGNIGQVNYAASKAGIIGMAKTLAKELARKNVCVNVVAPGYTATEMMNTIPEKILDGIRAKVPMQRLGEPKEIADAFLFLASDEAKYITGHVLSVNGGLTL